MAYTEAELTARITALETALDRHERTVQFADRSVTYTSTDEIRSRIAYFRELLNTSGRRQKQFYLTGHKGL